MHCKTCGAPGYVSPCASCVNKSKSPLAPVARKYELVDYPRFRNLIASVKNMAGPAAGELPCLEILEMVETLARYGIGDPEPEVVGAVA